MMKIEKVGLFFSFRNVKQIFLQRDFNKLRASMFKIDHEAK